MVMEFELEGQKFSALDGGPVFTFTPANTEGKNLVLRC
jgi:predicted 3-demethylubiquinone-9 3-methyltransferase (glyoxalase superfamily)